MQFVQINLPRNLFTRCLSLLDVQAEHTHMEHIFAVGGAAEDGSALPRIERQEGNEIMWTELE